MADLKAAAHEDPHPAPLPEGEGEIGAVDRETEEALDRLRERLERLTERLKGRLTERERNQSG